MSTFNALKSGELTVFESVFERLLRRKEKKHKKHGCFRVFDANEPNHTHYRVKQNMKLPHGVRILYMMNFSATLLSIIH